MKKLLLLSAVLVFTCLRLLSQNTPTDMHSGSGHIMVNTKDLKWMDAPPGLPKGAKAAVLSGDPGKEGPFAIRVMFPAGYKVPPHTHPIFENVVVLEGSLYMGSGEKLDEAKAMLLEAGGYSSIPAMAPHYVFAKEACTIQVNSQGPFSITYINPADDPRNQK